MQINEITHKVIQSAFYVHSKIGIGVFENIYQICLAKVMKDRGLKVLTEVYMPVIFEDTNLGHGYRIDMLIEDIVILELKAVEKVLGVHKTQLLSYLKLSNLPVGLLINFHEEDLKNGITRIINPKRDRALFQH